MAGDTDNPRIWIDGDVYTALVGSSAPTDTTTAWSAAWHPLGLLSEDGLTETRDEDSNDFFAWGGILVRTQRSKHKRTFKLTALEDNAIVFDLVNPGSTVDIIGGTTTRSVMVPHPDKRAFGMELVDGAVTKRIIVPTGEITEVGDVVFSDSEIAMRELTITVYPDDTGLLYEEITNDIQAYTGS